jgi:hypothetical protein
MKMMILLVGFGFDKKRFVSDFFQDYPDTTYCKATAEDDTLSE